VAYGWRGWPRIEQSAEEREKLKSLLEGLLARVRSTKSEKAEEEEGETPVRRGIFETLVGRGLVPPEGVVPKDIEFRHIAIFGKPGSGKTSLALTLAAYVEAFLRKRKTPLHFYCIRAMHIETALNVLAERGGLPEEAYVFLFIDDAERFAFVKLTGETIMAIVAHDLIRHRLRELGMRRGVVTIVYATQTMRYLAVALRNADIIFFRPVSIMDEPQRKFLEKVLGKRGVRILLTMNRLSLMDWEGEIKACALVKTCDNPGLLLLTGIPLAKPSNLIDAWEQDLIPLRKEEEERRKATKIIVDDPEVAVQRILMAVKEGSLPVYEGRKGRFYYLTVPMASKMHLPSLSWLARTLTSRGIPCKVTAIRPEGVESDVRALVIPVEYFKEDSG